MNVTIPCPCPPKADGALRHEDGDIVGLRETLDFRDTVTLKRAIQLEASSGVAEILGTLTEMYVVLGVESWTLVDEKGHAVPATRSEVRERLLPNVDSAMIVADAADELYMESVIVPLVMGRRTSSPSTQTAESTSRTKPGGSKLPKPSKPSSTTSSLTVVTGPMGTLPASGSNSSPSSASAA